MVNYIDKNIQAIKECRSYRKQSCKGDFWAMPVSQDQKWALRLPQWCVFSMDNLWMNLGVSLRDPDQSICFLSLLVRKFSLYKGIKFHTQTHFFIRRKMWRTKGRESGHNTLLFCFNGNREMRSRQLLSCVVEEIHCLNSTLKPLLGSKWVSNNSKKGDKKNTNIVPLRNLTGKLEWSLAKTA